MFHLNLCPTRQKVREEIERDKRERAAKFAKKVDEAAPGGATSPSATPSASAAPEAKKECDQCRLQVCFPIVTEAHPSSFREVNKYGQFTNISVPRSVFS